jgi:membrane peptidoglycan carboxypeptidase
MAGAYAAFANDGEYLRPTGIAEVRDAAGKVVFSGERRAEKVIGVDVASGVREALRGVVRRGTGTTARVKGISDIAGKTGTTEDHRDAWFVGFARGFAIAVWVGYPQGGKTMERVHGISVTGSSFPAQIWKRVLGSLVAKYQTDDDVENSAVKSRRDTAPTSIPTVPEPSPSEEPSPTPEPRRPRPRCPLLVAC